MIIIREALYVNGIEKKLILAKDITKADYKNIYKGKLFCPTNGCLAKYEHREVQKRGNTRYFCTMPNSEHRQGCPNKVNREGERTRKISIDGVGGIALSEEHARDVLRDTFKVATGKKKKKSNGGKKRNNNKSSHTTTDDAVIEVKTSISRGGKIEKVTTDKQPYIYKKSVSDFLVSPIDTYCVYGELVSINIGDDEVIFNIRDSKYKLSICAGNPFKVSYPQEFKLLKKFKQYFDSSEESRIICACICISKKSNDGLIAELMDYRNIYINNLSLIQVIEYLNQ